MKSYVELASSNLLQHYNRPRIASVYHVTNSTGLLGPDPRKGLRYGDVECLHV